MSGKMLVPGTPAGPFPARRASRRRERSARLTRLSLPYLSPDRAKSRRSPSRSVESFLTVRGLGFPREFGFGVRRRGVVVSGLGTVRISVGTPTSFVISFRVFQPGVWVFRRSPRSSGVAGKSRTAMPPPGMLPRFPLARHERHRHLVSIEVDELPAGLDRLPGWSADPHAEHRWLAPEDVKVDILPASPKLAARRYPSLAAQWQRNEPPRPTTRVRAGARRAGALSLAPSSA